jgi:CBS domain-containing protein
MRAVDLMTRQVLTVAPTDAVRDAARLLAGRGFTALPVVDDDGVLVGVVTEADVVRERIPDDPRTPDPAPRSCPQTVGDIMTSPAMAMPQGTDAADLARFMLRNRIRSVPILDGDRLVGIVTRRDLVRSLTRSDAAIATDIRHRLEVYGGPDRWQVCVQRGRATINDRLDDPVDAHVAKIIALAVPGVEFAKVVTDPVDHADRPAPVTPIATGRSVTGP